MDLKLRPGRPEDAETCGQICYEAFAAIARKHNFPVGMTPEAGIEMLSTMLGHPGFYSVVAEANGQVVGSNFLDERSLITGVGPITVDPAIQDGGVGRALMQDVMRRATERTAPGNPTCSVRVPQPFAVPVRQVAQATALVVEHDGRISGYATGLAFFAHAVGESNEDLKALIMAADAFEGPSILVPTTNADLFRWCSSTDSRRRLVAPQVGPKLAERIFTSPASAAGPSCQVAAKS